MHQQHINRIVLAYVNPGIFTMSFSMEGISAYEICLPGPNDQIKAYVSTEYTE